MANRYWVGGTGTWDTTTTTNWSATPGGAGGASVPTAADSVFFDRTGNYTVTMTGALNCLDITCSAGSPNFVTGTSPTLSIAGSLNFTGATVTWGSTAAITFTATTSGKTITPNGTSFASAFTFNGVGGVWTLGGALTTTSTSNFTISNGTFDTSSTGNYALTMAGAFTQTGGVINLNASTVTLSSTATILSFAAGTFNAGTSQINVTNAGALTFAGAGRTYYNVAFTGAASVNAQAITFTGTNTFNNLSFVGPSVVGYRTVSLQANQTVNSVLSTTATAGNRRVWIQSATFGMQWDLVVNGTTSLTDVDFRDIRVIGTAVPISGTRIGNTGGCSGITFSTPKTVYWNLAAGGNFTSTGWALTSGGAVSTNNHPLTQDTAVIVNTGLNASASIALDVGQTVYPSIDISGRTLAMTLSSGASSFIFGGDIKLSNLVTISGTGSWTFSGRNTQTITSSGRTFTQPFVIDSPGGIVQLADAFIQTAAAGFTVTNGAFNTNDFAFSPYMLRSINTNVRSINLGASTVTFNSAATTPLSLTSTYLTFNAGTSSMVFPAASTTLSLTGNTVTLNNVTFNNTGVGTHTITGAFAFNNFTVTATTAVTLPKQITLSNDITIGTLSFTGATAIARLFVQSSVYGTQRTINLSAFSAGTSDIDFRDINITGAAINTSITRGGDCGGNSGIIFPAPKTVYWNLTGGQNWNATAWAATSGGTPALNNFPLAQDTAVFDNTGAATTISIPTSTVPYIVGSVDMSARSAAMTLTCNSGSSILVTGNWKNGSGTSITGAGTITFIGRGSQTITSAGKSFSTLITQNNTGTLTLADALITTTTFTISTGTFNANNFNVTCAAFVGSANTDKTIYMGSGTWTLTGSGSVWSMGTFFTGSFYSDTSTLLLSDATTTAKTFSGGPGIYYNRVLIGGAAGAATYTFSGGETFGEIASSKTAAFTVSFNNGSYSTTIGKWSITGASGALATITAALPLILNGDRVSGVNFLAMGTTAMNTANPVEFYAGPNSTGTGTGVILTAAPAPVTRYWVGGTGTWDATTTTNWSATSGGAGGASVPTSADTVIFNSASSASSYTVTLTATQLRCASLSISGPASGTVTFAGTAPLGVTQSLTIASTGVTRTWTGALTLSGTGAGKSISCGVSLSSNIIVAGIGSSWALTSALSLALSTNNFTITNGSFDTAGFAFTVGNLIYKLTAGSQAGALASLSLGASSVTIGGNLNFASSNTTKPYLFTFNAGTSSITLSGISPNFYHGGKTFYDVTFSDATAGGSMFLNQSAYVPTFNNLTLTGSSSTGSRDVTLGTNIIVNGTLTFSQSLINGIRRINVVSDVVGTQRTITAAAVAGLNDIDFRDINCAGAATWSGGTRIGDCGGNGGSFSGSAPKTVYWSGASSAWAGISWATTSGGAAASTNFPLAQDTAIFNNAGGSATVSFSASGIWNIGNVDMSARTSALSVGITLGEVQSYGNITLGTGVTWSFANASITLRGRGTQTITSNGVQFVQTNFIVDSSTGTVQLADAFNTSGGTGLTITSGTFNAVSYNVTLSSLVVTSNTIARTLSMGSGTWTVTTTGTAWSIPAISNFTLNKGTASIVSAPTNLASTTFAGGGLTYNKLTIGGTSAATGSFTITGNNTFSEITSTRTVAYTLSLTTTTQTVGAFTVTGSAGKLVTILGTSVTSFATLIYTGSSNVNIDYVVPTSVKVYDIGTKWYSGTNSINGGSYGWIWSAALIYSVGGQFFAFF